MPQNPQIHLVSRPTGEPTADNFKLVTLDTPALQDNQVLVRHAFLSLDPYMRGRMNDTKSYTVPQPLNSVMIGGTVGEVVESRHPKFAAGDKVVGMGGCDQNGIDIAAGQECGIVRFKVYVVVCSQPRRAFAARYGHQPHP